MTFKKKEGFTLKKICDSDVIIPNGINTVNFNKMLCLNESAALLWKNTKENFNEEDLTSILQKEYQINNREEILDDIKKICQDWLNMGIIERVE